MTEKIKKNQSAKKSNLYLLKFIYLSLIISVFGIIFVLLSIKNLPPVVPLLYGMPEGEEVLVKPIGLITPSLTSIIILFINICIAQFTYNKYLKNALVFSSFIISVFAIITTIKISFLVGSF